MKVKNYNKIISLILILIIIFQLYLNVYAGYENNECFSWYCKRNMNHFQPVLPSEFEFIRDFKSCYYLDTKNSNYNSKNKILYLTFDAGYENGNVERTLDILKSNNVKATFFILSNLIIKNKDLVIRMANDGHLIGNHTSKHKNMSCVKTIEDFKSELETLEEVFYKETGMTMSKYFRPPEGRFSHKMLEFSEDSGYKTIFWSFAYADWDNKAQMKSQDAKKKIFDNIHNGAIILLHPTSDTNVQILDEVIKELKLKGFRFETVDKL